MKKNGKARIGFIGCGMHATWALYPAIHTIPEIDLVAVCDLNKELAQRNARNFGARRWYTNVDKMLSDEKLDGTVVVGPPQMQCSVGKQCLDRGLPIFVEKPSAISYKEAINLAEYAKKKKLFGGVAYMKRSSTCYQMAKEIISKKEFGKISFIDVKFSSNPYPSIWGIKENSKSFLIGQVVHLFNLIRFFGGEVAEIYAKINQVTADRFGYAVTVQFKNGVVGVMNLNSLESAKGNVCERLSISGYDCYLEVIDMLYLRYRPSKQFVSSFASTATGRNQTFNYQPEWGEFPWGDGAVEMFGYKGELQNFAQKILGKEKLRADLFDGTKDLQIAETVWESVKSKKPVKIIER